MQKVRPFLWYDDKAEEAANLYVSVFKNSKILDVSRRDEAEPDGSVMMVTFQLDGQEIIALNGGPHFKFTPASSFFVSCENQEEVDYFWERLSEGGEKGQCGWLTDKFGLSWQIVPTALGDLLGDPDPEKSDRVMKAMLQMRKLDIAALKRAYDGA